MANPNPKHKFSKGNKANPHGRPPLTIEDKAVRSLTKARLNEVISKILNSTPTEIDALKNDKSTDALTAGSGTESFYDTVGGTIGTTATLGLPTATHGWLCSAYDVTTTTVTIKPTNKSTSAPTFTASTAPTSGDVIVFHCTGY